MNIQYSNLPIYSGLLYFLLLYGCSAFKNITNDVFDGLTDGRIAAFGDFDSNRLTDIFVIKNKSRTVEVLLASEKEPLLLQSAGLKCSIDDGIITSVVPGDYDGDSVMDILVTVLRKSTTARNVNHFAVFWGSNKGLTSKLFCSDKYLGSFLGQPLVLDFDGNRIPDLFAQAPDMTRQYWFFNKEFRNASTLNISVPTEIGNVSFRFPHSNTFIDLNGDLSADLLVTTKDGFEIWLNVNGELTYHNSTKLPWALPYYFGQSVLVDIDLDGDIDHLLPVCYGKDCTNSTILLLKDDKWVSMSSGFPAGWEFVVDTAEPPTVRMGDYNMDGYPDGLVILRKDKDQKVYLLENVLNRKGGRTLTNIGEFSPLSHAENVIIATFYDIYADGIMDIILVTKSDNGFAMSAFKNEFSNDACFIKVMVLSGLCYTECEGGKKPLGVNQPGPMVCYKTTTTGGDPQTSCSGQLSQSAYNALQMPYVVFGLGQTPNFVDNLKVGIPTPLHGQKLNHDWPSIIPNSQMIIVPQLKNTSVWLNKMYVSPSHLALKTFIALIGTCMVIALIIAGLHWKERREDRKERLQAAHRFHFDAM